MTKEELQREINKTKARLKEVENTITYVENTTNPDIVIGKLGKYIDVPNVLQKEIFTLIKSEWKQELEELEEEFNNL